MVCHAIAVFTILWCPLFVRSSVAQDAPENQTVEQEVQPEMSREEWRDRVQAAKQRVRETAIERRRHPERFAPPPPEDPARIATDRVLGDDSLQPGDIVSTNKGLFVFRGKGDQPRSNQDFLPLQPR
jgi:hypothetical protein